MTVLDGVRIREICGQDVGLECMCTDDIGERIVSASEATETNHKHKPGRLILSLILHLASRIASTCVTHKHLHHHSFSLRHIYLGIEFGLQLADMGSQDRSAIHSQISFEHYADLSLSPIDIFT